MESNIFNGPEHTLLIIRHDDLIELATICVNRLQSTQVNPVLKQEIEQPISQSEAIKFLGKSRQTFAKWRKKGIVKARILGGRVYYLKSELIEAMK